MKNICLFDVDDTLLKAKGIYIYRKLPSDKKEIALTPEQFAKDENIRDYNNMKYYNFRDFEDPDKIYNSIIDGTPLVQNLQYVDYYHDHQYEIGILTARRHEEFVYKALCKWLKYKDKDGKFVDIEINREYVFAVNDKKYSDIPCPDADKKIYILKNISKEFSKVVYIDDDDKNIKKAKASGIKNLTVLKAE